MDCICRARKKYIVARPRSRIRERYYSYRLTFILDSLFRYPFNPLSPNFSNMVQTNFRSTAHNHNQLVARVPGECAAPPRRNNGNFANRLGLETFLLGWTQPKTQTMGTNSGINNADVEPLLQQIFKEPDLRAGNQHHGKQPRSLNGFFYGTDDTKSHKTVLLAQISRRRCMRSIYMRMYCASFPRFTAITHQTRPSSHTIF
jgi:hypothetical protein